MISLDRPRALLWMIAGFVVWSAAFLALYGLHALACEWGWGAHRVGPVNLLQIVLVAVWGLSLAVLCVVIVLMWRLRGRASPDRIAGLVSGVSLSLSIAALIATVWIGLPILIVPACV